MVGMSRLHENWACKLEGATLWLCTTASFVVLKFSRDVVGLRQTPLQGWLLPSYANIPIHIPERHHVWG